MSPRKNMKKAEEQHPPAPFAEDDTASQGEDEFEGLSQEFIDEYLAAYHALDSVDLNDDEEENVNDDPSEDSQSTPGEYEQESHGEILYLRSNGNEPPSQHRLNYCATTQPPQRPQAPLQQNTVPVAPPPTFVFRNAANPVFMAGPNVPQAVPARKFSRGILKAIERRDQSHRSHRRSHRPFDGFPEEHYPRGVVPGGYSRGVEGMPRDLFPHWSMPTMRRPDGRQNERFPFAPPRSLDRNIAPPMERDLLFEMWADAFVESRRMEQGMAAFRERLQRLYKFCYRS